MKKILTLIMTLAFLSPQVQAFSLFGGKVLKGGAVQKSFFERKNEEIKVDYALRKEKNDIKDLFCLLTKYSNEHNIEGITSLYDKNYKSFDGFDYDTFKKMLEETFAAYDDISYKSDIKNISIYGDKAVVSLVDTTNATLTSKKIKDTAQKFNISDINEGVLEGECNYVVYLKKIDGQWRITGDNIISETTSIKYGAARQMPMELIAPINTKIGEEYCLGFKMDVPKGAKAVAALGNEEIMFPSAEPKEIFRKLPSDGILERVVRANKKGLNEYAMASVGLTKIDITEDMSAIRFQMTGMAFLMQRVNLYAEKNPVREIETKDKKDAKDEKAKG